MRAIGSPSPSKSAMSARIERSPISPDMDPARPHGLPGGQQRQPANSDRDETEKLVREAAPLQQADQPVQHGVGTDGIEKPRPRFGGTQHDLDRRLADQAKPLDTPEVRAIVQPDLHRGLVKRRPVAIARPDIGIGRRIGRFRAGQGHGAGMRMLQPGLFGKAGTARDPDGRIGHRDAGPKIAQRPGEQGEGRHEVEVANLDAVGAERTARRRQRHLGEAGPGHQRPPGDTVVGDLRDKVQIDVTHPDAGIRPDLAAPTADGSHRPWPIGA